MPGIKRKSSFPRTDQRPVKLKKQSTSTTVDKAIGTLKSAKSVPKFKSTLKQQKSVKPKLKDTKNASPPPPLPRFPTLVPTKPASLTGFNFNFYKASQPADLKRDATVMLPSVSTGTEELSSCTKATEIERSIKKLPSGSYIGKIVNDDDIEDLLPSDVSLAVYEYYADNRGSNVSPGTSHLGMPVRQSAYDVAEFFASSSGSDRESSSAPSMPVLEEIAEEEDDIPPVLESASHSKDTDESSDGDASASDNDDAMPKLQLESPTKTPSKSPRKMTGGQREIVFSFDTTGSMYNYMEEAKDRIPEMVNRLQEDMPGTRLAFVAHGDYYDLKNDRYLIKWIDFGASIGEVVTFFEDLPITHGGDADECYELVLQKVRESMSWSEGSQRSLVMIGDSDPHEPGYTFDDFVNDIDWRVETEKLNEMGVRIYGVQVGYRSNFYKEISKMTGGAHLRLDAASFTCDTLMAICLREGSIRHLKGYEHEVRTAAKKSGSNGGSLDLELERLFSSLKNIEDNKSLKQRAREIKIKNAKIQELSAGLTKSPKKNTFTGIKSQPQKRPSEETSKPSAAKKSKSDSASESETKAKRPSFEKSKKTMKLKTPSKKEMKKKPGRPSLAKTTKSPVRTPKKTTEKSSGKQKKSPSKKEAAKVKNSPGRPKQSPLKEIKKKSPDKPTISPEKKKQSPGRPKVSPAVNTVGKKSPGRPKLKISPEKKKQSPGRPKVSPAVKTAGKKSPGRPKVSSAVKTAGKKSPGRPKVSTAVKAVSKMSPGRPKLTTPGRPKQSTVGRPKKSPISSNMNKKSTGKPKSPKDVKKSPVKSKQLSSLSKQLPAAKNVKKSPGRPKLSTIAIEARKKMPKKLLVSKATKKSPGRPKQSTPSKSKINTNAKSQSRPKIKSLSTETKKRGPGKPPVKSVTKSGKVPVKSKPVKRLQSSKSIKKVDSKAKPKQQMNKKGVSSPKKSTKVETKKKVLAVKTGVKKLTDKSKAKKLTEKLKAKKLSDKSKANRTKLVKKEKLQKGKVNKKLTQKKETKVKKVPGKGKTTASKNITKKKTDKAKTAKMASKVKVGPKKTVAQKDVKTKSTPSVGKKTLLKVAKSSKVANKDKKSKEVKAKAVAASPKQTKGKGSGLLCRENVNNSAFNTGPISNMKWTQWEPLICPSQPKSKNWPRSLGWCSGYCNENIFKGKDQIQAVHEIAVVPPSGKKYPVFYFGTKEATFKNIWDYFSSGVRKEIERVIKCKGTIITRRGSAPGRSADSLNKSYDYIKSNFDYAWKSGSRDSEVIKDNFVVSKSRVK